MQASRLATALLFCLCLSAVASAVVLGRSFSMAEYNTVLDRLTALTTQVRESPQAADTAIEELRGDWKLEADGQVFEVNTTWMVDQFEQLKKNPESDARDRLLERIKAMKADAQSFQQTPLDFSTFHNSLDKILARSEFHQVHGPTWLDRLKLRISMWIFRLLSRFFGSSAAPVVGRIFVWTLVAIAVFVLAFFI